MSRLGPPQVSSRRVSSQCEMTFIHQRFPKLDIRGTHWHPFVSINFFIEASYDVTQPTVKLCLQLNYRHFLPLFLLQITFSAPRKMYFKSSNKLYIFYAHQVALDIFYRVPQ